MHVQMDMLHYFPRGSVNFSPLIGNQTYQGKNSIQDQLTEPRSVWGLGKHGQGFISMSMWLRSQYINENTQPCVGDELKKATLMDPSSNLLPPIHSACSQDNVQLEGRIKWWVEVQVKVLTLPLSRWPRSTVLACLFCCHTIGPTFPMCHYLNFCSMITSGHVSSVERHIYHSKPELLTVTCDCWADPINKYQDW